MTERTIETEITFTHPFELSSFVKPFEAGTYRLIIDEEEIEGLSYPHPDCPAPTVTGKYNPARPQHLNADFPRQPFVEEGPLFDRDPSLQAEFEELIDRHLIDAIFEGDDDPIDPLLIGDADQISDDAEDRRIDQALADESRIFGDETDHVIAQIAPLHRLAGQLHRRCAGPDNHDSLAEPLPAQKPMY